MSTSPATAINQPAAHALLRQAHDGGYRFPADFHGFTATVHATESAPQGTSGISGKVTVSGPRSIEIASGSAGDLVDWTRGELASMAGHRWHTPYEEGDGRWSLELDDETDHVLGLLITVHDDPFTSRYRVRDGHISQVIRTMGNTSFTITMQRHQPAADARSLPADFTVSFWDTGTNRLVRTDSYTDTYATIDGVSLPVSRRVVTATDDGFTGRELTLTDITLHKA